MIFPLEQEKKVWDNEILHIGLEAEKGGQIRHCSRNFCLPPTPWPSPRGVIKREESVPWPAPFYVLSLPLPEKVDCVIAL